MRICAEHEYENVTGAEVEFSKKENNLKRSDSDFRACLNAAMDCMESISNGRLLQTDLCPKVSPFVDDMQTVKLSNDERS